MFQTKAVGKIRTHILRSITFPENRAVYEIMWEIYGTARQVMDDNIIRRMRFACWITKAIGIILRICNAYCFSTAKMVTRTRLNVTLYAYCLSCLLDCSVSWPAT
jgi:hypothetical protein